MRKISLILVLVLCFGMLAGCSGINTTPTDNGAAANIKIVSDDTVVISVDKNNKVLAVSFIEEKTEKDKTVTTPVKKENTIFKDTDFTHCTLDEALSKAAATIVASGSEVKTEVVIKKTSISSSESYVNTLKEEMMNKLRAAFDNNNGEDFQFVVKLDTTVIGDSANAQ